MKYKYQDTIQRILNIFSYHDTLAKKAEITNQILYRIERLQDILKDYFYLKIKAYRKNLNIQLLRIQLYMNAREVIFYTLKTINRRVFES